MNDKFEMVAKTFQGLENVLADELRAIGAENVETGRRVVSFEGDKAVLYRANFCCRTALRILKPFYKFHADDADQLYEAVKKFDWDKVMTPDRTFSIDSTVFGTDFRHSKFVTYRVKDAIVDYFMEKYERRPSIRLTNADCMFDVHISGNEITLSLDSSGESLHKRGYRVAQTEAPINEVLAAGIILMTGWRGESDFVDPMCGSGTFLIEAAMIARNIFPGVYRNSFAFERWSDFDSELFDEIYNDDSSEREFTHHIYGSDVSPKAISIARSNVKSASLTRDITLEVQRGEVVAIIGAPGGGKSTLLRCATLLERMDAGSLSYAGLEVARDEGGRAAYADKATVREARSRFGLVFQGYNLFPHWDVMRNICDAPETVQGRPKEEAEAEARELVRRMGL